MPIMKQNDIIDVIYDTICGYKPEEAYQILEKVRAGQYISVEWIKNKKVDFQNENKPFNYLRGMQDGFNDCIDYLLSEWEKENAKID